MALAGVLAAVYRSSEEPAIVSFTVPAPEKTTFGSPISQGIGFAAGSVSPDGRTLTFTAGDGPGKVLLWIRPLAALAAQPFPGTEGAGLPFWSPDSRSIGFFAQGKLKKVDVTGGAPEVLCDAPAGRGGTWNREGIIVFAPNFNAGLYRVSSAGGEAVALTKLMPGQTRQVFPAFLPGGRHFIYHATAAAADARGVFIGALDSGEIRRLLPADSAALYAPPGYLLFVRQGNLFAQLFDAQKLELAGDPVRLAESVPYEFGISAFSVSESGVLTYRTGPVAQGLQLAWFDRTGKLLEPVGAPGGFQGIELSPDTKRIAVHRHDSNGGDIWVLEAGGNMQRFTFDAAQENSMPIWSPDGRLIVFASVRNGKWGIYKKPSNSTGGEELLIESDLVKVPMTWSPDGKSLVYVVIDPKTDRDLWLLSLNGERKPSPLLNSPSSELFPQISPDGKWIAYRSDETGQNEIYVKAFPSGEGKRQTSTNGGNYPRWRRDGKELFFFSSIESGKVMSVAVNGAGPTFEGAIPGNFSTRDISISASDTTATITPMQSRPTASASSFPVPPSISRAKPHPALSPSSSTGRRC